MANRIKQLRENLGLSSRELSDKTGIPYDTLKNYEYNRRKPSAQALAKLENYFNTSGSYILGDTPEPTYSWQDNDIMSAVQETFPVLIDKVISNTLHCTTEEQKILFDVFVELRHITSEKSNYVLRTATLLLLQDVIYIISKYSQLFFNNIDDLEDSRYIKLKTSCMDEFEKALLNFKNSLE